MNEPQDAIKGLNLDHEKPGNKQTAKTKKASDQETIVYQITGEIETRRAVIEAEKLKAGRFILATNILDKNEVTGV